MIHCTVEDLIALKDGEGTAWARRHLPECAVCQQQLDALHQRIARLKALPSLNPPRDRWPVVRDAISAERNRKRRSRVRWASMAVAASVALVFTARSFDNRVTGGQERAGMAPEQALQALVTRSQQLEATLNAVQPENRVMSGAEAGAVAALEDRIAAIDARLGRQDEWSAAGGDVMGLWQQRVELMQGLVNVHVTRASYLGM
jgi:hypothetical protein